MIGRLVDDVDGMLEDLAFLADTKVGLTEAARRTGFVSAAALEKWCERRGHSPLATRLRHHEPISLARNAYLREVAC